MLVELVLTSAELDVVGFLHESRMCVMFVCRLTESAEQMPAPQPISMLIMVSACRNIVPNNESAS